MTTALLKGWDMRSAADAAWVPWGEGGNARAKLLAPSVDVYAALAGLCPMPPTLSRISSPEPGRSRPSRPSATCPTPRPGSSGHSWARIRRPIHSSSRTFPSVVTMLRQGNFWSPSPVSR